MITSSLGRDECGSGGKKHRKRGDRVLVGCKCITAHFTCSLCAYTEMFPANLCGCELQARRWGVGLASLSFCYLMWWPQQSWMLTSLPMETSIVQTSKGITHHLNVWACRGAANCKILNACAVPRSNVLFGRQRLQIK